MNSPLGYSTIIKGYSKFINKVKHQWFIVIKRPQLTLNINVRLANYSKSILQLHLGSKYLKYCHSEKIWKHYLMKNNVFVLKWWSFYICNLKATSSSILELWCPSARRGRIGVGVSSLHWLVSALKMLFFVQWIVLVASTAF